MKIGFLADLHLNMVDHLSHMDPESGFSVRTVDRLEALDEALRISASQGCKLFILGGDLFDKLNIPERLKEAFYTVVNKWLSSFEQIIIFTGNHDGATFTHNYLSEQSILKALDLSNKLKIIDKFTVLEYPNFDIFIIPWITDHSKIEEFIIDNPIKSNRNLLFGHFEVKDAIASTEYVLTGGLKGNLFKKFKRVFLGHYHKYQQIGENIIYVGSPIVKDLSEMNSDKGFIIYDTNLDNIDQYLLEKRTIYRIEITPDNAEEIDDLISSGGIEKGSIIEINVKGPKDWVNEASIIVKDMLKPYEPLKLISIRTYDSKEAVQDEKVTQILSKHNRLDKLRELTLDEDEESLKYGLSIFERANNKFLEIDL